MLITARQRVARHAHAKHHIYQQNVVRCGAQPDDLGHQQQKRGAARGSIIDGQNRSWLMITGLITDDS